MNATLSLCALNAVLHGLKYKMPLRMWTLSICHVTWALIGRLCLRVLIATWTWTLFVPPCMWADRPNRNLNRTSFISLDRYLPSCLFLQLRILITTFVWAYKPTRNLNRTSFISLGRYLPSWLFLLIYEIFNSLILF